MDGWRIASASVAGASHLLAGTPCQDAHACRADADGLVAIASDGAGTAAHSDEGASIAVQVLGDLLDAHAMSDRGAAGLDAATVRELYARVVSAIGENALAEGREPRDYSCTLLAAFVDDGGGTFMQVGDGAAVIRMAGETAWRVVLWPQRGEYANETNFVVGGRVLDDLDLVHVPGRIEDVVLITDGLENLVLDKAGRTAPPAFFEHVAGPVRGLAGPGRDEALSNHLARYLGSPDVSARTDDDVTLVVACRGGAA